MNERLGEKMGWIGGWVGSFLWIGILALVWIAQGKLWYGIAGVGFFAAAMASCFLFAPWRHPETLIWKLLLPLYLFVIAAIVLSIAAFGGWQATGMRWWNLVWVCLLVWPFFTLGRRCWRN